MADRHKLLSTASVFIDLIPVKLWPEEKKNLKK